jgi:hypothetical protein
MISEIHRDEANAADIIVLYLSLAAYAVRGSFRIEPSQRAWAALGLIPARPFARDAFVPETSLGYAVTPVVSVGALQFESVRPQAI